MNLPYKPTLIAIAILALCTCIPTSHAQDESPLRSEHQQSLEKAETALAAAQDDQARALALKQKGIALDSLGQAADAVAAFDESLKLKPDDAGVRMNRAIALDAAGRHYDALAEWETLRKDVEQFRKEFRTALYGPGKGLEGLTNPGMLSVATEMYIPEALNRVFVNQPSVAQNLFGRIISVKVSAEKSDSYTAVMASKLMADDANYAERWKLWLTAYLYRGDAKEAATAVQRMAAPGAVRKFLRPNTNMKDSSAFNAALKQYYTGTATFEDVLKAIDTITKDPSTSEGLRTEAHFFCAGYLRYVKQDKQAAIALLEEENKRPFNGSVERLFIQRELAAATGAQPSVEPQIAPDDNEPVKGTKAATLPIPTSLGKKQAEECILRAFTARDWKIEKTANGKVVGTQQNVTMTAVYDDKQIEIYCAPAKQGGKLPQGWVDALKKDIAAFLKRLIAFQ